MHKEKTILFVTDGNIDHASSRIRAVQYFPYLEKNGFRIKWIPRISRKKSSFLYRIFCFPPIKRFNFIKLIIQIIQGNFDILFIQRFFMPAWLFQLARKKKKKIVFDFDDAIYLSGKNKTASQKTGFLIRNADLVIVGSPVLKEYSGNLNRNCVLITSPVRVDIIKPVKKDTGAITVGWLGSEWTSKYLNLLTDVFIELKKKHSVNFHFMGSRQNVCPGLEKEIFPWSIEKEPDFLSCLDIGIMPLTDNEFERGKGGYKLFQYMAAGIPVVASSVGINKNIVIHGHNGFLCNDKDDWLNYLDYLIFNREMRERMGLNGLKMATEKYSLKVCAKKLVPNILQLIK